MMLGTVFGAVACCTVSGSVTVPILVHTLTPAGREEHCRGFCRSRLRFVGFDVERLVGLWDPSLATRKSWRLKDAVCYLASAVSRGLVHIPPASPLQLERVAPVAAGQ